MVEHTVDVHIVGGHGVVQHYPFVLLLKTVLHFKNLGSMIINAETDMPMILVGNILFSHNYRLERLPEDVFLDLENSFFATFGNAIGKAVPVAEKHRKTG